MYNLKKYIKLWFRDFLWKTYIQFGQVFGLVDVAQGFPHFRRSFASFDVCQLFLHQTRGDNGEGLLGSPFVRLLELVAHCGRWRQLQTLHDLPKIFGGHHHLQLELIEVEVVTAELIERDVAIALTRSHFATRTEAPTHSMHPWGLKSPQRIYILILKYGMGSIYCSRVSHTQVNTFPLKLDAKWLINNYQKITTKAFGTPIASN